LKSNKELFGVGWGKTVATNKRDRNVEVVVVVGMASRNAIEGKLVYIRLLSNFERALDLRSRVVNSLQEVKDVYRIGINKRNK
jgi:hypothetical protein